MPYNNCVWVFCEPPIEERQHDVSDYRHELLGMVSFRDLWQLLAPF